MGKIWNWPYTSHLNTVVTIPAYARRVEMELLSQWDHPVYCLKEISPSVSAHFSKLLTETVCVSGNISSFFQFSISRQNNNKYCEKQMKLQQSHFI